MITVLLLKGGGGTEHEVSLVSAKYMKEQLDLAKYRVLEVLIDKDFTWLENGKKVELNYHRQLVYADGRGIEIDFVIMAIHGPPAESGELGSYLELLKLPYLGPKSEASSICFNKISTKLWLEFFNISTTPFTVANTMDDLEKIESFFDLHQNIYIKASNQGSSVGCYPCSNKSEIKTLLTQAFTYSDYVVVEKTIKGRELEVSVFEYKNEVHASLPGEILTQGKFYSYDEKYSQGSHTTTDIVARDIPDGVAKKISEMAKEAFIKLKLKDLTRVDFFYSDENIIYLNEPNTIPGMTPISMFPKMMEHHGVKFSDFLDDRIQFYLS